CPRRPRRGSRWRGRGGAGGATGSAARAATAAAGGTRAAGEAAGARSCSWHQRALVRRAPVSGIPLTSTRMPSRVPDVPRAVRRDHLHVPASNVLRGRDLTRPVEGRMVAGVAAGLADALGLDPNVVRCGFVVLAIASGFGVILYAAGWALMPG